jgi:proton-coupled amino acid transporter
MTTTSTANEGSHNSNESSHHVQQQRFEIMDHDGDDDAPSNSRRARQNNNKNNKNKLSNTDACISLGKAIMGAGSFVLPWSFSQMGYIGGPIFLSVLCLMSVHSIQLLSSCALHIEPNNNNNNNNNRSTAAQSYVDIARCTFGNSGSKSTFVASIASSIGVCGSYLIFIASNLQSLIQTTTATTSSSTATLIWLLLPVVILLSSVRDMKHFSFASLLGDISVMLGMLVVLVYGYTSMHNMKENNTATNTDDYRHHISLVALGSISNMAIAFGSIGYLFLVHFLVIPIQSNMIYPHQFSTKVVPITFTVCAMSSTIFGLMGYIMFQEPQQIVLLNITKGSFFIASVKLLLCVDLIFTYPVVMRPSIIIIEEFIFNCKKQIQINQQKKDGEQENEDDHHSRDNRDEDQQRLLQQQQPQHDDNTKNSTTNTANATDIVDCKTHMVVCTLLGIVAASASTFIPAFGLLSGLVGGVSQTFLAFVMPPLMYGKQKCQQSSQSPPPPSPQESILDLFVHRLTWKEKSLVVCGFILIVWTLQSTWNDLRQ